MTVEVQKPSLLKVALIVCACLILVVASSLAVTLALSEKAIFAGATPTNIGVESGKLAPCPTSPNCVSSQSQDAEHKIEPLTYTSSLQEAMTNLKTTIENMERTKIIEETDNYLYAEFTSKLMGFVDDVEFFFDESANVIQIRSASRLGESDLGVNRQRIETIRGKLN
jgi:uncharacterized protein (DUF1499 family)